MQRKVSAIILKFLYILSKVNIKYEFNKWLTKS